VKGKFNEKINDLNDKNDKRRKRTASNQEYFFVGEVLEDLF
jgi:hypothetical protein